MTLTQFICDRLKALGTDCSVVGDEVHVVADPQPTKIRLEEGWVDAFRHYRQARSIEFDCENRVLVHNNSVEHMLVRLAPGQLSQDQYVLQDAKGNSFSINTASIAFALAFFESEEYENYFRIRVAHRHRHPFGRRCTAAPIFQ